MDIRAQAMENAAAAQQAAATPSGCKACERTGIPVFPLRTAAVPASMVRTNWHPTVPVQPVELSSQAFKYALRTLRMGYLYVLLDKSVWQAYEVTAEACFRQFNPYDMPEGSSVMSLSPACRTAGHDVIASFINLDEKRYNEAWLAFSSDPWSRDVLEGYKNALRPDSRFTKISLSDLKNAPARIPGAMVIDPNISCLKANVAEFATAFFADTARIGENVAGSVHGFFPRTDQEKQRQMSQRVIVMGEQYQCPIVALPLTDSVGIVQELNNARMQIAEATQAYLAEPGVYHRHMISLAITAYLKKLKHDIDAVAQPQFDIEPSQYVLAGPSFGKSPTMISKEDVAKNTFAEVNARLMKSYDEPARAAFEQQFDSNFSQPQKLLAAIDNDLAAWYQTESWLTAIHHDYSPDTSVLSWFGQNRTLAVCVQGGAMGSATDKIWQEQWLNSGTSPAYLGFTGMDLSQVNNVFNFGNYKTALTVDEFGAAMKSKAVQQHLGMRMLAVSGSACRLWKRLKPAQQKGAAWMIQAAMQSAGEPTLVLQYQSTLGRLQQRYSLGGESTANGSMAAAAAGSVLAVRAEAANTPVTLTQIVPGTIDTLRQTAAPGNMTQLTVANSDLHAVTVSDLSLAGRENAGVVMQATNTQLAEYNLQARRIVSGDSVGMVLGAGLMAIQMFGWHELQHKLSQSVGNATDVTADTTISTLLMMEGLSEMTGLAVKLANRANWLTVSASGTVPLGVRFGGVLGGIAGIVEGVREGVYGYDSFNDGDDNAGNLYTGSAIASSIGGVVGIYYGAQGIFAFTATTASGIVVLGPAGWAALLLLTGVMLATKANTLRSTPFEIWLRRTCFGIPNGSINALPVWQAESQKDLATALADYQAIISGMVAKIAFGGTTTLQTIPYDRVEYRVELPGWNAATGGWSVKVTSDTDNRVLFSASHNAPGLANHQQQEKPASTSYPGTYQLTHDDTSLVIKGSIWTTQHRTKAVTMVADYWPDRNDGHTRMGLTVSAVPSWMNSDTTEQWRLK